MHCEYTLVSCLVRIRTYIWRHHAAMHRDRSFRRSRALTLQFRYCLPVLVNAVGRLTTQGAYQRCACARGMAPCCEITPTTQCHAFGHQGGSCPKIKQRQLVGGWWVWGASEGVLAWVWVFSNSRWPQFVGVGAGLPYLGEDGSACVGSLGGSGGMAGRAGGDGSCPNRVRCLF